MEISRLILRLDRQEQLAHRWSSLAPQLLDFPDADSGDTRRFKIELHQPVLSLSRRHALERRFAGDDARRGAG